MNKLISIIFLALLSISCTKREIGQDPLDDGRQMMLDCLMELSQDNVSEANKIMSEYLEYYSDKPLEIRVKFLQGSSENYWCYARENPDEEWVSFFEQYDKINNQEAFKHYYEMPDASVLQMMYKRTKDEAKQFNPNIIL